MTYYMIIISAIIRKKQQRNCFYMTCHGPPLICFKNCVRYAEKKNWNATKRYEEFSINHVFDGGCKLAEAFHSLIHKYNINLLHGSIVFTMPKETALKLKIQNQDSPRFQGLKPLFPGSELYTDAVRKQYILMDTQQPYDYPKKKQ